MATTTGKTRCLICQKEKSTSKCSGCLEDFCFNHLAEHRQQLKKHSLIQQINQWENDSIIKIQQIADETKQLLLKYTAKHIDEIEKKLIKLTEELKHIRDEDDFNEIDLNKLKQKLKELKREFNQPSNISIEYETSSAFINKVSVVINSTSEQVFVPNIDINTKWIQNGITMTGDNGQVDGLNRLCYPTGIYVDSNQTIYVVNRDKHCILQWKNGETTSQVVAGGNGPGDANNQLNIPTNIIVDEENDFLIICDYNNRRVVRWPRQNGTNGETIISNIQCCGLAMDNQRYIYVSDISKHEVRRWKIGETNGTLVAGGNGRGNRLDQLHSPQNIFVDEDQSVYISDWGNHRVMKWIKGAKEGIVVAGGQGVGNGLSQLSGPFGIIVDRLGTIYVTDYGNHRVMCWSKEARQGIVVVGGYNQLKGPVGLSFDRQNNLYVVDHHNHRIQKFIKMIE